MFDAAALRACHGMTTDEDNIIGKNVGGLIEHRALYGSDVRHNGSLLEMRGDVGKRRHNRAEWRGKDDNVCITYGLVDGGGPRINGAALKCCGEYAFVVESYDVDIVEPLLPDKA